MLETGQLGLQLADAGAEHVNGLALRGDDVQADLDVVLGDQLAAQGSPGEAIEPVGLGGRAGRTKLVGVLASGFRLPAPGRDGPGILLLIVCREAKIAGELHDGLLRLGDIGRVAPDQLIQHLARSLG